MQRLNGAFLSVVACGLGLALAGPAGADSEDVIKYRQAVMKAMGGHTTALSQIVRGQVPYAGQLEGHAAGVVALTRDIPALFPEGSDFGETDAKPEIWKKRAEFEKAAGEAARSADAVLTAARGGDKATVAKAFDGFSQTCKGCHEDFRAKR